MSSTLDFSMKLCGVIGDLDRVFKSLPVANPPDEARKFHLFPVQIDLFFKFISRDYLETSPERLALFQDAASETSGVISLRRCAVACLESKIKATGPKIGRDGTTC